MKRLILLLSVISLTSCASYNFMETGLNDKKFASQNEDCPIKVLTEIPEGLKYSEIGFCRGKAPGGGIIADYTHKAIEQLKKCACENGGNAILLKGYDDKGYSTLFFGYIQATARASAVIIRIEDDNSPF